MSLWLVVFEIPVNYCKFVEGSASGIFQSHVHIFPLSAMKTGFRLLVVDSSGHCVVVEELEPIVVGTMLKWRFWRCERGWDFSLVPSNLACLIRILKNGFHITPKLYFFKPIRRKLPFAPGGVYVWEVCWPKYICIVVYLNNLNNINKNLCPYAFTACLL